MGDTVIRLQKGTDSHEYQLFNKQVKTFLNGKKEAKEALRVEHPEEYSTIQRIWEVRMLCIPFGLEITAFVSPVSQ